VDKGIAVAVAAVIGGLVAAQAPRLALGTYLVISE
jgi:hypothetical protein